MDTELIPIEFNGIVQSQNYTVFILGNQERQFAIYTSPHVGKSLKTLPDKRKKRPYTHELIHCVFSGFDIHIIQVVITDVQDSLYFASLFVEQEIAGKRRILEIDARPSDCLTLALGNNAPIYCTKKVFANIIPIEK